MYKYVHYPVKSLSFPESNCVTIISQSNWLLNLLFNTLACLIDLINLYKLYINEDNVMEISMILLQLFYYHIMNSTVKLNASPLYATFVREMKTTKDN